MAREAQGQVEDDDRTLVFKAASGDEYAFRSLYERYEQLVWLVAFSVLLDQGDADDACQETWLKIFRFLRRFEESRGAFRTWICKIARHTAIDFWRRNKRSPLVHNGGLSDLDARHSYFAASETKAHDVLFSVAVKDCVATLPDTERTVVLLIFVSEELGIEVAALLGVSSATVTRLKDKGIDRLRHCLQGKGISSWP